MLSAIQAPAPLPSAHPALPETAQRSAAAPIRDLLARSEPTAAAPFDQDDL